MFLGCAVPEANHKVYALEPAAGSLGMGMGGPHVLIAPSRPDGSTCRPALCR